MGALLVLLAFPFIWPFVAKKLWHHEVNWIEVGLNVVGGCLIAVGVWFAGTISATSDTEIWNGQVISKERVHGHYTTSYSCPPCTESCSGSGSSRSCTTTCSTCYEDHYTVDWIAKLDFGRSPYNLTLDSWESTSRRRRDNRPDPAIYKNCAAGQPASIEQGYTNYVQAVPDSLFHTAFDGDAWEELVPSQPRVHGKYRINRVMNVNSTVPAAELQDLNDRLNLALRSLGPQEQVNFNVIVTGITDPSFRHTVENQWLGGEKNDVTVFIGTRGTEILWTDVMTFALNSGNELFHVKLRDELMELGTFDSEAIAESMVRLTDRHFDRIEMATFEYLKNEIKPSDFVIALAAVFSVAGSILLSFLMRHVDIGGGNGYRSFHRPRFRMSPRRFR
jgi:hypothetical protein